MPLTLQDIRAEKQRRALLYQIRGERERRQMAAGRVQSPGVVAPTNHPPPSKLAGTEYVGTPLSGLGGLKQGVDLASRFMRPMLGSIDEGMERKRQEEAAMQPGLARLGSRAQRVAEGSVKFFAGMPEFANQIVNPEQSGMTTGGAVKEAGRSVVSGLQKLPMQLALTAEDLGRDLPLGTDENYRAGIFRGLSRAVNPVGTGVGDLRYIEDHGGLTPTEFQAQQEYQQDPSAPINTLLVTKGLAKTAVGVGRRVSSGLKPRAVVPEKAPSVSESQPIADTKPPVKMIENAPEVTPEPMEPVGKIENAVTGKPVTVNLYHGTPDGRFAGEFNPKQAGYYKNDPSALPDNKLFNELHGGTGLGFKDTKDGIFFTTDKNVANSYADDVRAYDYQNAVPMVLNRDVTLKNPKVIDWGGQKWRGTESQIAQAKAEGHDGIIIKNVIDTYSTIEGKGKGYKKPATNVVVFDSKAISSPAPVSPQAAKQPTSQTWYAGHGEGKPTGKYLYVTDSPEYAKQFGEVRTHEVSPKNTADFSYLGERSVSRERAIAELKKKGVDAQIPLEDDVYKPMWQWVRKYPQIADQVKSSGFDSMAFKETFGGAGKRHNSLMILDESKSGGPIEPPKPPVEPTAPAPEPKPESNVSSLSIRTEADAIAKKLTDDFGSLPEYKTMDMKDQANRAKSLIDADLEKAKRIAMGHEAAPGGLRDASVYEAVKFDALKSGDVETLRKLAVESTVPSKLSAYGQEIKAADSKLLDDPVRVMQDVAKTRQEYAKRTGQRYTSEEIKRLQDRLADAEKKLSERVKTAVSKAYGAKNRIVSTATYLAARERIKASLATAHSGIPPELLVEVSKIGAYHLEAGTRLFADWSAKMVSDLGEQVKPHLNDIWKSVGNDRRLQIALKAQKTRLEREAVMYRGKLEGLDFTKPEKRTLALDPEARRLKVLRDVAKRDWEAALNSYGSVTKTEAANIVNLSKDMTAKLGELEKGGDRFQYGAARVAYENYVNYLKGEQAPLRTLAKAGIDKFKTTAQTNKAKAAYDLGTDALKVIVNNSVSMVATLDNSFQLRQGIKVAMTHPSKWVNGFTNSFADIWKTLGGKDAHAALMADVYSRPNYLNGYYEKAGILAKTEEQFPSSLPERIPGVGRVFKASENAFTGSALRMRTGVFDLLERNARESGVNTADPIELQSLGKLVNSLTARGKWGKTGEPAVVRLVMWAPRMLKGNIDVLTAHGGGIGLESSFARKEAAKNLLKIVGETAVLITIANALKPGSAETDPRSSDFGKIKIGNTRYDYTGGAASIVTLAARISTGARKSTNTGEIIPYGTKFGQASELDALVDFLANKTNPPAHVAVDWLRGRDYKGDPFSFGTSAFRATTPIIVQQAINLKDDHSANAVAGVILDGLGVNSATYAPKPAKEKKVDTPEKVKKPRVGPISQADIDSIPSHIQVKYQGIKSKSGEKVQMTGNARQVLRDLYAESELYTKILESLT